MTEPPAWEISNLLKRIADDQVTVGARLKEIRAGRRGLPSPIGRSQP